MKEWVYGRNTVRELLKNGKVSQILIQKNTNKDLMDLCKKYKKTFKMSDKKELNDLVGHVVHQGVAALVESYDYASLDEIL